MHHPVILNYAANAVANAGDVGDVHPDPDPVKVRDGHTISFKMGTGPPEGKVRVSFTDPQFFSVAHFNEGDANVRVTALPTPTTYLCELLVNGEVVASSKGRTGGG